ncbi:unnamed protein product [Polarella glacialis]|uniref:WW domain-containing protein n=1 Tax=Polarella glacialis TaxID=89957 RepID=A0A813DSX0_POLGL|nr:unnamed protein product [Polarella glacialis]
MAEFGSRRREAVIRNSETKKSSWKEEDDNDENAPTHGDLDDWRDAEAQKAESDAEEDACLTSAEAAIWPPGEDAEPSIEVDGVPEAEIPEIVEAEPSEELPTDQADLDEAPEEAAGEPAEALQKSPGGPSKFAEWMASGIPGGKKVSLAEKVAALRKAGASRPTASAKVEANEPDKESVRRIVTRFVELPGFSSQELLANRGKIIRDIQSGSGVKILHVMDAGECFRHFGRSEGMTAVRTAGFDENIDTCLEMIYQLKNRSERLVEFPGLSTRVLLGKGGEIIQKVQSASGVDGIYILPPGEVSHIFGREASKDVTVVRITGTTEENIDKCVEMIHQLKAGDSSCIGNITSALRMGPEELGLLTSRKHKIIKAMQKVSGVCILPVGKPAAPDGDDAPPTTDELSMTGPEDKVLRVKDLVAAYLALARATPQNLLSSNPSYESPLGIGRQAAERFNASMIHELFLMLPAPSQEAGDDDEEDMLDDAEELEEMSQSEQEQQRALSQVWCRGFELLERVGSGAVVRLLGLLGRRFEGVVKTQAEFEEAERTSDSSRLQASGTFSAAALMRSSQRILGRRQRKEKKKKPPGSDQTGDGYILDCPDLFCALVFSGVELCAEQRKHFQPGCEVSFELRLSRYGVPAAVRLEQAVVRPPEGDFAPDRPRYPAPDSPTDGTSPPQSWPNNLGYDRRPQSWPAHPPGEEAMDCRPAGFEPSMPLPADGPLVVSQPVWELKQDQNHGGDYFWNANHRIISWDPPPLHVGYWELEHGWHCWGNRGTGETCLKLPVEHRLTPPPRAPFGPLGFNFGGPPSEPLQPPGGEAPQPEPWPKRQKTRRGGGGAAWKRHHAAEPSEAPLPRPSSPPPGNFVQPRQFSDREMQQRLERLKAPEPERGEISEDGGRLAPRPPARPPPQSLHAGGEAYSRAPPAGFKCASDLAARRRSQQIARPTMISPRREASGRPVVRQDRGYEAGLHDSHDKEGRHHGAWDDAVESAPSVRSPKDQTRTPSSGSSNGRMPGFDWSSAQHEGLPALSGGSNLHREGDCIPCGWFWKPKGCLRGDECGYCHLCPDGEVKLRKKAKKLDAIRAGNTPSGASIGDPEAHSDPDESRDFEGEPPPREWFSRGNDALCQQVVQQTKLSHPGHQGTWDAPDSGHDESQQSDPWKFLQEQEELQEEPGEPPEEEEETEEPEQPEDQEELERQTMMAELQNLRSRGEARKGGPSSSGTRPRGSVNSAWKVQEPEVEQDMEEEPLEEEESLQQETFEEEEDLFEEEESPWEEEQTAGHQSEAAEGIRKAPRPQAEPRPKAQSKPKAEQQPRAGVSGRRQVDGTIKTRFSKNRRDRFHKVTGMDGTEWGKSDWTEDSGRSRQKEEWPAPSERHVGLLSPGPGAAWQETKWQDQWEDQGKTYTSVRRSGKTIRGTEPGKRPGAFLISLFCGPQINKDEMLTVPSTWRSLTKISLRQYPDIESEKTGPGLEGDLGCEAVLPYESFKVEDVIRRNGFAPPNSTAGWSGS